jgi:hypothetical protein
MILVGILVLDLHIVLNCPVFFFTFLLVLHDELLAVLFLFLHAFSNSQESINLDSIDIHVSGCWQLGLQAVVLGICGLSLSKQFVDAYYLPGRYHFRWIISGSVFVDVFAQDFCKIDLPLRGNLFHQKLEFKTSMVNIFSCLLFEWNTVLKNAC